MKPSTPTLAGAGELAFIRAIRPMLPEPGGRFLRTAGEDCLVSTSPARGNLLHTIDTFVDGVHFNPAYSDWEIIGHRIMAATVSDIAAMAGKPSLSLVSMSMPGDARLEDMTALFKGMHDTAMEYGCPVAGGETTSTTGPVTVTITVMGVTETGRAITRAGAKPGDRIFVTGTVGDAMAGLMAYERGIAGFDSLKRAFAIPRAQVKVSRALAASYRLTAMIDISDGLATDLRHICNESGAGADIQADKLPLSDEYRAFAATENFDPIEFALRSGEEFQILFTTDDVRIPGECEIEGVQVQCIGEITGNTSVVRLLHHGGEIKELTSRGYEHFRT